jgi:steroid delta-isomerase-like uncharacterized protein
MRTRAIVSAVTFLVVAVGCATSPSGELNANKDLVREFTEAANAADWDGLAEIVAKDFTRHSAATDAPAVTSRDGFIELQKIFLSSFPDQRVLLEQLVAEGDLVAALATYSGTQTGPMGDFPATGKTVQAPFLAMFRVESDRIAELGVEWDNVAMLTQLGLFPPSPPSSK